jgi:excinuclease ABC subunit A
MSLKVSEAYEIFSSRTQTNSSHEKRLFKNVCDNLKMALEMGLNHLSLLRKAKTLSAGEYQRLLLIKYLSFQGTDSLFVLDEPSLGLSEVELKKLMEGLELIVDQGNTVILIDHSEFVQKNSDHLFVMGPGSGKNGGEILYQGSPDHFFKTKEKLIWEKKKNLDKNPDMIEVVGPIIYHKAYSNFKIPLHQMTWVTGASGTGKTACLIKIMANTLYKKQFGEWLEDEDFKVTNVRSPQKFDDVIVISSDLNRFTSRSTVGTVTELSSIIRKHFLKLPVAKAMNLKEGHLSANSELGMCLACMGRGVKIVEMHFMEDVEFVCDECQGKKLKPFYANISDGNMTVFEAHTKPLTEVLANFRLDFFYFLAFFIIFPYTYTY